MEALSGAFKVFAEKHLTPSVISLIVGAIVYLLTPDDNWMIEKLTKFGYWLFVSVCFFIIIQLLFWIKNKIQEKQYNRYLKRSNDEHRKKEVEENLLNKKDTFVSQTKTRKSVFITMITLSGIERNSHSDCVTASLTLDDLFN